MIRRDDALNKLSPAAALLTVDLDHHSPKPGLIHIHQGRVFPWGRGDLLPGAGRDRRRPSFKRRGRKKNLCIVDHLA